jgi:DNA-directed RNA polymerase specialized sigma24 family protein
LLADASRHTPDAGGALNEFADRYYDAVRAFIAGVARPGSNVDDLTQRFFETAILGGRVLPKADRARGPFRPYLRQAIRNFLVDEYRREAKDVRADVRPDAEDDGWGGIAILDAVEPEREMLRAWAKRLVALAVGRTRQLCEAHGQAEHFALFAHRYLAEGDPPSWRDVGSAFGLDEKLARNRADTAARQFRTALRQLVAQDVGGSDSRIDDELRAVMGLL